MMDFTEPPSVPSDRLVSFTGQLRLGGDCLPGPFQGLLPRAHGIRSALLSGLVR
jgi:hypothetical protein